MAKNFAAFFIILLLASVGNLFAQNIQELRIGSFISGNVNSGQEIWYSVRTAQTGFITVETDSNIDTYLVAYDAQRNQITENDDGGEGLNAKI